MSGNEQPASAPAPQRRTQADYDQLPYPSLPVAYCHPASIAAMASLFGVAPPKLDKARVLELGCASGGNIIPLAAKFPDWSFVGIDLSQGQVDEGKRRIAALGLKNISIQHGDVAKTRFEQGAYDYVLCHGVFSWVPKPVQDAILRICKESLAPGGVATISYNVLPGWHLRRVVRDICLFHAGTEGPPAERAAKARAALIEIAKGLKGTDVYSSLMRNEAQRIQKMPAAYVVGEFLAENNLPCHFTEFYLRSRQAGLAYLCDAEVATSLPEYLLPASAENIRSLSAGNPAATQQYIDFYSGRPFRRTLLVHADRLTTNSQSIDPAKLRGLHFAAELSPDRSADGTAFTDTRGRKLASGDARATELLKRLASAFPSTLTVNDLMAGNRDDPNLEPSILKTLLGMMSRGQATAFAVPLSVGDGNSDRPIAWPVARLDAQSNQPWITSLHHRAVRLVPSLALLLPLMDGSRTRADLVEVVNGAMTRGELKAPQRHNGSGSKQLPAESETNAAIGYAARNGLLI